jgi:hypothetical protein
MKIKIMNLLKELLVFLMSSSIAAVVGIVVYVFRILQFGTSAESGWNAIFVATLMSAMIGIFIHGRIEHFSKNNEVKQ